MVIHYHPVTSSSPRFTMATIMDTKIILLKHYQCAKRSQTEINVIPNKQRFHCLRLIIRMNDNWWLRGLQGDSCQIHNRCMRRHKWWLLHALIDRSCRAPKSIVAMLYSYQSISTQPETNISPRLKPNQFWILELGLCVVFGALKTWRGKS